MKTTQFLGQECVTLENSALQLLVTRSVGPRILALRFKGGENLFAELPDAVDALPDGRLYHLYGGHRLWHAPEDLPRSYQPDDAPVEIAETADGLVVTQAPEAATGMQKSLRITLAGDDARADGGAPPGKPRHLARGVRPVGDHAAQAGRCGDPAAAAAGDAACCPRAAWRCGPTPI